MNILQALVRLRDDLKLWVTNNLQALREEVDSKSTFSGEYEDLNGKPDIDGKIESAIEGVENEISTIKSDIEQQISEIESDLGDLSDNIDSILDDYATKEYVNDMLDGKALKYLTTAEFEKLSLEEKNRDDIVYQITDAELSYNDLIDKPIIPDIVVLTQDEYNTLKAAGTINPNTYYLINEEE